MEEELGKEIVEEVKEIKPSILWLSDLVAPTGFSRVSHSIIKYLLDDFDITGLGINYRGDPHPYKFPIFPASAGGKVFGEDRLISMLNNKHFDLLFILNDAWVVNTYLEIIKTSVDIKNRPEIIVYFPVDSEFHQPEWYKNFDIVTTAVTYTEFAKSVVNHPLCVPELPLRIIPHGTDSEVFYKKYTNRKDAKIQLFRNENVKDDFIILSAGRNQPRKRLDIILEAFKLFADGKDSVKLYMHCGIRDAHIDIARMAKRFGIDNKLILTNLNQGIQTVPDMMLNDIYNAADIGINTSMGEGWGLPSVEHAMTGAAQIVPNHSACGEIFKDCGELVKPKLNYTFDHSMTVGKLVDPIDVAISMDKLYTDIPYRENLANKALEKFTRPEFSWKEISKLWKEVFLEVVK
jgi:D-inositol-3-phosphate glycosyltransferase